MSSVPGQVHMTMMNVRETGKSGYSVVVAQWVHEDCVLIQLEEDGITLFTLY